MHWLFAIARLYPFIAGSIVIVLMELGRYYRRRRHKHQWIWFGVSGFLIVTILIWLGFRGDKNSDLWIRYLIGNPYSTN